MLNGDFSAFLTGKTSNLCGAGGPANLNFDSGQVFNPYQSSLFTCPSGSADAGQQVVVRPVFGGNQIPTSTFDPVSLKFNTILPRTTDPLGLVRTAGRIASQDYEEFTIKPDYYVNERNHLSFRAYYNHFTHPLQTGAGNALLSDRSWTAPYENYGANWLYTIRPTLLSNLVVSYNTLNTDSVPGLRTPDNKPVCFACFGVNVAEPSTTPPGIDSLNVDGGFGFGQNTNLIDRHNTSIAETINWTHGNHMVVAGVSILSQYWQEGTDWLALPLFNFSGQFSGNAFADYLLGASNSFTQGAGEYNQVHGISWAGFVQDTYRLKPNLSVVIGARWEPFFAFTVSKGRIPVFEPGVQSSRYPDAPLGLAYPGDAGVPSHGVPNNLALISPRISAAWQPGFSKNTVIRAAFGIFATPFEMSFYNHAADSAPFSPTYGFGPTTTGGPAVPGGTPIPFDNPWSVFQPTGFKSPFPPFASPDYAPGSSIAFVTPVQVQTAFNTGFKLGQTQTWNLAVEHQFGNSIVARVGYIGTESFHLPEPIERNPGIYSTNPSLNGLRSLYPNFSSVLEYNSGTTASYNGLQLTFEKKFSHGLQFTANYSWSKSIDSFSSGSLAFNGSIPNPFDLGFNRGISDLNFPKIFNAFWVYQMPGLSQSNPFVRGVLGGWEFSGVWKLQSGQPFSINGGNGSDNSQSHVGQDRADLVSGQALTTDQGSKSQWLNQYFNTAAFQQNAPGTFGNSPRNIFQAPGVNNADFSVSKNFPFKERYRLQFRWEMFNVFNRTVFGVPDHTVTDGSFGQITNTLGVGAGAGGSEQSTFGYPPRVMQAALKFYF